MKSSEDVKDRLYQAHLDTDEPDRSKEEKLMRKERMRGQETTAATMCIAVVRAVGIRNHSEVVCDGHTKGEAPWEGGGRFGGGRVREGIPCWTGGVRESGCGCGQVTCLFGSLCCRFFVHTYLFETEQILIED